MILGNSEGINSVLVKGFKTIDKVDDFLFILNKKEI